MTGFKGNIEKLTVKNKNFRKVLFTAAHSQLVVMSLKPQEEIGEEVHKVDQFFRFEKGEGKVVISGKEKTVKAEDAVVVPANLKHNVINTSKKADLKLYTIYSPPQHPDKTIHATKKQAEEAEKKH